MPRNVYLRSEGSRIDGPKQPRRITTATHTAVTSPTTVTPETPQPPLTNEAVLTTTTATHPIPLMVEITPPVEIATENRYADSDN